MYFSRLTLQEEATKNPKFWQSFGTSYAVHQSIWRVFDSPEAGKRDFIYRIDSVKGTPAIYTISTRQPVNTDGIWSIGSKPYSPKLSKGQRLGFTARINPVVTKQDPDGKRHRHDVVMEAKTLLKREGKDYRETERLYDLIRQEGTRWMKNRAEKYGFVVDEPTLFIDAYQQHRFTKEKGKHDISISTLDYSGVLTVTDPDLMLNTLFTGIGHAKGFGYGLVMVRPL
ncbi:type I-E CRISPR-associated protein Cas6/Cse3/CasE [Methanoregula sp.]|jgi:CRISPR system Cascade subunit CasE|uniref:type I-E CRISPR-associated protein Cas6/Cse3/CasE n=1 Tax=Methanoregula sp. TaxID=2052170 RepID=UPI0025FD1CE3|nr:type I-E CRISPR-associated protein Cas6/Cse3/CasE [Methanoregula sp.]